LELSASALVVEVDAHDLRGLDGGEVDRFVHGEPAALNEKVVALADHARRTSVEHDSARLHGP